MQCFFCVVSLQRAIIPKSQLQVLEKASPTGKDGEKGSKGKRRRQSSKGDKGEGNETGNQENTIT